MTTHQQPKRDTTFTDVFGKPPPAGKARSASIPASPCIPIVLPTPRASFSVMVPHNERLEKIRKLRESTLKAPELPPLHLSATALARAASASPSIISNGSVSPAAVSKIVIPKGKEIISNVWETRIKERTYDLNLVTKQMPVYEPLLDDYLWDYFQNPKTRRHLTDLGLVARDGTIIDHKDFKYAQIRLQKMEYERNILKQDQERILDREIEIAIRKKAKTDKMRMQEHFQSMPDPASRAGKPYPEFLQNYPVTMWRTVLLYAQRPPSLTHVGVPRQRPKTSRRPNTSKTPLNDSEKVHQLFSNARKEFDAGNLEATSNILCEIITLIKKPISQTSLNGDHMKISQAIQDAIEKAGIILTGTERLLIGYIQKLGGDVETVIQHLQQGRKDSHPLQSSRRPSAIATAPQQPTPPQDQPRKSITARPQSARPNRKAQFPNAGSFTNIIGTASSPNIPVLDRPNSARKNRDADFPAASSFSIGNQSESVTSVHLERPASPRLNRGVSVNEHGEKGGVKALEEERAEIEAALESELAGFERVEESGSGAVAGAEQAEDEYKYEEEGFESGVAGNATESSEAHAVNEASPEQQSTAVEDLGLHEEETTVESVLKEVEPKVEDENKPISDGVQASEKSSEDAPAEEAAGLSESANPEDIAASTEESSPSEEAATTDPTQQERLKAQELKESEIEQTQQESFQQESGTPLKTPSPESATLSPNLGTQQGIQLGSSFLTQTDIDHMFRQDSANSFMYGGITGARADSTDEIRSNSQIGSQVPSQYASQTSVAGAVASSEKVGHGGTKLRDEILEEGGRESDVVGGGQNEVDEKAREDEGVEGVIDQRELAPQQDEPDLQYESEQEPEMAEAHYLDHNAVVHKSEHEDFEHEESQGHVAQELKDENAEPQAVSELKKSLHSLSASLTKLAEGAQSASVKGSRATLVQSEENKTATEPATSIWDDIFSFASNAPVRSSQSSK